MWQKIKCWLGIRTHYLVSFNYLGEKATGFGHFEFTTNMTLDMDFINDTKDKIEKSILKQYPNLKSVNVAILGIIKLER